ncbi:MAG: helix-turn-helix transcriptional regulator [Rhizonema sp. PD37]|nr:helix-turn-helix transcriptional regulator [Rhizonema sp. PD37]
MNLMQVTLSVDLPGLGSRIKELRESKGLSPTWVAAQAGMSVANLYRIESEDAKSLPRETLRKLSQALEVDFDAEVKAVLAKEAK